MLHDNSVVVDDFVGLRDVFLSGGRFVLHHVGGHVAYVGHRLNAFSIVESQSSGKRTTSSSSSTR